jgi:hypothetical protein
LNLPRATQALEPSKRWNLPKATKHWNLPRATKHWNLPLGTKLGSSFTSFLLLLFKSANLDHFGFSFPDIIFEVNLEKFVLTIFLGRRKMISFSRWRKEGE